ncbi:Sialidase precursor [Escherichia coli]|uniref:sialidase family protein n=1 Tax=Escherichia coli TaxID=562 RepID=UPI0019978C81|nr:sialidase family protein [Escherichia coli]CAD5640188.1 Sialidase precursor [Escherichia coli]CAD5853737.1 Sialidase precursor [Escherichia coli]CAD6115283.1 Sialidase precursor [Escherichia coli]
MKYDKTHLILMMCFINCGVLAKPVGSTLNNGWDSPQLIFSQHDMSSTNSYRIPAITSAHHSILAVSDIRGDGTSDIGKNKDVHFAYKISHNHGDTWSSLNEVIPDINGKSQISDPAIIYNPKSKRVFLFGFYNDKFITSKPLSKNSDFFVFTSDDDGNTWDNGKSIKKMLPSGYHYILQGPGSGMYYNGAIYVAVQAWYNENDKKNKSRTSTSGFIYSYDNGKTWGSAWLRPTSHITGYPGEDELPDITSESSIFHHDGYIYLSAKPETKRENKGRVVFRTNNNGQSWERIEEKFIPYDISRAESSSLSLDDHVYLVGYSRISDKSSRDSIYITTNTGKTIKVFDGPVYGYTSMAQDKNNLYITFEGEGDIYFKRYDLASNDYANLNATILNRSDNIFHIQSKLKEKESYIEGEYGEDDRSGAEFLYVGDVFKFGIFHSKDVNLNKHVAGTIKYSDKSTTLSLAKDNTLINSDNIFIGYQSDRIDYVNQSSNNVDSIFAGYSANVDLDILSYELSANGIYSRNNFSRNKVEGLGRRANFYSHSLAIKNTLFKEINISSSMDLKNYTGLKTTLFNHDGFTEEKGNGWNNITLNNAKNISNELFADVELEKRISVFKERELTLLTKFTYQYEMSNIDKWSENYTVLDSHRVMSPPVKKRPNGLATGYVNASLHLSPNAETSAFASLNSDHDTILGCAIKYVF